MQVLERAALAAVDDRWTLETLVDLLSVPSVTGTPAEARAQRLLAQRCHDLGLDVDLWRIDLDAARADPGFPGTEVDRAELPGMVATLDLGGPGPTLILNGHVDVVPPGETRQWAGDPFVPVLLNTPEGGRLRARGACDMKAGLVAALAAVRAVALIRSHFRNRLRGRLALHVVASEEDGGLGSWATLRRGHVGDLCIIPEPTAGTVISAAAGALTFRLDVAGRSAHGATRDLGISALDAFAPVQRALAELERERNRESDPRFAGLALPYALSIGTISAGEWASTVPDRLVAQGRFGVRLGEDVADARRAFEAAVAEAGAADPWLARNPVVVTWWGGQFASAATPLAHPLTTLVQDAAERVTGRRPAEVAAPYGSDLRHYLAAGIPTVQHGPGDIALAHSVDESVPVAEVLSCARTLALVAVRALAGAER